MYSIKTNYIIILPIWNIYSIVPAKSLDTLITINDQVSPNFWLPVYMFRTSPQYTTACIINETEHTNVQTQTMAVCNRMQMNESEIIHNLKGGNCCKITRLSKTPPEMTNKNMQTENTYMAQLITNKTQGDTDI